MASLDYATSSVSLNNPNSKLIELELQIIQILKHLKKGPEENIQPSIWLLTSSRFNEFVHVILPTPTPRNCFPF